MNRKKIIAIVSIIFAIAIALGLMQRSQNPFNHENIYSASKENTNKDLSDYYQEGQSLKKKEYTNLTTTFLAVGDISLSRNIAQTIKEKNDPLYPFKGIEGLLKSTNFNFANLETPFSNSDVFTPKNTLVFNAPKANVLGLKAYNFTVLNLANNHALDQGIVGLNTTKQILNDNGLLHMGTGINLEEAWKPAIINSNGIKIGFIGASYSSVNDGGKTTNNFVARIEDTKNLQFAINNLKLTTDFIVVTMHAGTEYTRSPNQNQIDFAHAAIDAGADLVIGAHPHWVQTTENYKGKYIFYSLGNFIFDQNWSKDTTEGLALRITLTKSNSSELQGSSTFANLEKIELKPIIIDNNCCAREATEQEAKTILKKINLETNLISF